MKKISVKSKKYEEYLISIEKPSVEITFKQAKTLPWESKCGGCPYLTSEADYPLFVQSAPVYYDNGKYDILLLQLDCDDACEIMFGDSGNCYFLISKEDLKIKKFDNVQYGWQCC